MSKKSEFRLMSEAQALADLEKIKKSNLPDWAKEFLMLTIDPNGKTARAAYYSFRKGENERLLVAKQVSEKYNIDVDRVSDLTWLSTAVSMHDNPAKDWPMQLADRLEWKKNCIVSIDDMGTMQCCSSLKFNS